MGIEIFDLDGTLTEEFSSEIGDQTKSGLTTYSFWNLITRDLVIDKDEFDSKAASWKKMVTTTADIDKVQSSKKMTEVGIELFQSKYQNADAVRSKATEITKLFCQSGAIIFDAIKYLSYRLSQGVTCIISTASYEDGARGFVDGLVACKLLTKELANRIVFSGTRVDWEKLQVTHMNVDKNKLLGLTFATGKSLDEIRPQIKTVFGDDPEINDRALLNGLCKRSFVISTVKNKNCDLPNGCVRTDWKEIYSNAVSVVDVKPQNTM
jgi:hypothetical protein